MELTFWKNLCKNFKETEYDNRHLFGIGALYVAHLPAMISTLLVMREAAGTECAPLAAHLFGTIGVGPAIVIQTILAGTLVIIYVWSSGELSTMGRKTAVFYSAMFILIGIDSLNDTLAVFHHPYAPVVFNMIVYIPSLLGYGC
jgi:hypothetical protein